MDQKFVLGGTIGYGDLYSEYTFRQFKVFKLYAKLLDAAGAVRTHSEKSLGNFNMIGRGPTSCLLDHVTGLPFGLYVKVFLLSFSNFVDA